MNKNNKNAETATNKNVINSNLTEEFGDVNQYKELDAIGTGEFQFFKSFKLKMTNEYYQKCQFGPCLSFVSLLCFHPELTSDRQLSRLCYNQQKN